MNYQHWRHSYGETLHTMWNTDDIKTFWEQSYLGRFRYWKGCPKISLTGVPYSSMLPFPPPMRLPVPWSVIGLYGASTLYQDTWVKSQDPRNNEVGQREIDKPVNWECLFLVRVAMTSNCQPHDLEVFMLEHATGEGNDAVLLEDQLIVHSLLPHHPPKLLGAFWRPHATLWPYRWNSWHHLRFRRFTWEEEFTASNTWSLGLSGISVLEDCGGATKSLCLWYFHRLRTEVELL